MMNFDQIVELEKKYLTTYDRLPIPAVGGDGCARFTTTRESGIWISAGCGEFAGLRTTRTGLTRSGGPDSSCLELLHHGLSPLAENWRSKGPIMFFGNTGTERSRARSNWSRLRPQASSGGTVERYEISQRIFHGRTLGRYRRPG
jgi:hypothetical protein